MIRVMPDTRRRRGPHPKDEACFGGDAEPLLTRAVDELSWLRGRGYAPKASLELVGNRYGLRDRQRRALQRAVASDDEIRQRLSRRVDLNQLENESVLVDGYNVILTIEAALSGGVLILARDGVLRDLAALSRHYRRLEVTEKAVELVAGVVEAGRPRAVSCLLDRPVSNSGRLKGLIESVTERSGMTWTVELSDQVDRSLIESSDVVASADSVVLDRCSRWINLARIVVEREINDPWMLTLGSGVR